MAKRQKTWAVKTRFILMRLLGGKCMSCGTKKNLTFDCVSPNGDKHHKYDSSQRMSFYRKQLKKGNLQLLCENCNAKKGNKTIDYRTTQ